MCRMEIQRGVPVSVIDATGAQLQRIALSGPKRGEDFPVVWVCREEEWEAARLEGREPDGVPWPREDVWAAEAQPA
jgi:hypothetical protein